jgi:hypothetical protein
MKIKTGPVRMVLLVTGFVVVLIYGTISVAAEDLFWFMKGFGEQPARIVVYHDGGKRTELHPGDTGFEELSTAIRDCLSAGAERPSGIGFSDASLLDAYTRYLSVEAFFQRPVKLHAWFDTGEPTQMLFPLTGRHAELSIVLLGQNGKYLAGPPALKTVAPLREAVSALGYHE